MPKTQTPEQQLTRVILQIVHTDDWHIQIPSAGEIIELLEIIEANPSLELEAKIMGMSQGKRHGISGARMMATHTFPELSARL